MKQDIWQLTVYILCDESTGCDEVDDDDVDFTTEADTMINTIGTASAAAAEFRGIRTWVYIEDLL